MTKADIIKEKLMKNKEHKIHDYETKQLLDELSKMPPMVIATAYLHTINYTLYGEDVTEKWLTAIQNTCALEKAYREGYHDALQKMSESNLNNWIPVSDSLPEDGKTVIASTEHCVYPEARYTKEWGWEWAYEAGCGYWVAIEDDEDEVTAWMPLPKTYKAEGSDKE